MTTHTRLTLYSVLGLLLAITVTDQTSTTSPPPESSTPPGSSPPTGSSPPPGSSPPTGSSPPPGSSPPTGSSPPPGSSPPTGSSPPPGSSTPLESSPPPGSSPPPQSFPVTSPPSQSSTEHVCGQLPCDGHGYFDGNNVLHCFFPDNRVMLCDSGSDTWQPVISEQLSTFACFGDLNFTVAGTRYWLKSNDLLRFDGTNWNDNTAMVEITSQFSFPEEFQMETILSAHFRQGDDMYMNGHFYCSFLGSTDPLANPDQYTSHAFFFNGTYYDIATDGAGMLVKQQQTTPTTSYYTASFVTQVHDACTNIPCCWVRERYPIDSSDSTSLTDYKFNGTWYVFSNGAYHKYNGKFSQKMGEQCAVYFSDLAWRLPDGVKYKMVRGLPFLQTDNALAGSPITDHHILEMSREDPLSTGGTYIYDTDEHKLLYYSSEGKFEVTVENGVMKYKRPFLCPGRLTLGETRCYQTPNKFYVGDITQMPCDLNESPSICGEGWMCKQVPSIVKGVSCRMGFCVPDLSKACGPPPTPVPMTTTTTASTSEATTSSTESTTTTSAMTTTTTTSTTTTMAATTTTTTPTATTLKKFEESCTTGADCHTGFCINSVCACTSCTKLKRELGYDYDYDEIRYFEKCIPSNSTVVGLGETCDMWADTPTQTCGMGMDCFKCPEVWNSKYAEAKCVALDVEAASSSSETCPEDKKCGYKSSCKMLSGVPECICDEGYLPESNGLDCYSWKVKETGLCNVTCGNGHKRTNFTCDKSFRSSVSCGATDFKEEPCIGMNGACPLPKEKLETCVYFHIRTKIITVKKFDDLLELKIKKKIAEKLTSKCISDQTTFEAQCCPGKGWIDAFITNDCINPTTGITFSHKFKNTNTLEMCLSAVGDGASVCCKDAPTKATGSRRKRAASTGEFDATALASFIADAGDLIASITDDVKTIDPDADVPQDVIIPATTTTTTVATDTVTSSSANDGGLPVWAIGVIAGGGALVIIIVVVVVVVIFQKKKVNAKVQAANVDQPGGPRAPIEARSQQSVMQGNQFDNNGNYPPYYGQYPGQQGYGQNIAPNAAHGY